MNIRVNHNLKIPVYRQIATQLRDLIFSGALTDGSVLPSERALAQILGVHRNTVIRAYNELKDAELITSMQGIGYHVTLGERAEKGAPVGGLSPKRVNWTSQIKEEYLDMEVTFDDLFQRFRDEEIISMGSGIATTEIYDKEQVAEDMAALMTAEGKTQYFYSPYQGDSNLRQRLVSFLSTKGIKATTGQIQILTETNQALDFLVTLLVRPGDAVVLEEPVSPDVYRAIELAGGQIYTVPVDENGMVCDKLEALIIQCKPRFIYVNSSFHDPTGSILSLQRRKKIVELSAKHRIAIVEEDAASELVYSGARFLPLKAFDEAENIIYIYSFSLTFIPGMSLAFIVGSHALIKSLSYLVSVRMMASDWLSQKLIAKYLGDGSYYRILDRFRQNYAVKQELICRRLDRMKLLGMEYKRPRGGVYIWCKLPEGIDSKVLTAHAHQNGLSVLPGYVFYPHKNGGREYIRLNYSYEKAERLMQGMDILQKTIEQELAQKK